jgi:predicted O-methyltransferase YrrM
MTQMVDEVSTSSRSPSFDDAWEAVAEVEGWLTCGQAQALFDGARNAPAGAIVEIGSHRARSTIMLARGAGAGRHIHAIDPFDNPRWGGGAESLRIFRDNIERAGVAHMIEPFRGVSAEALESWNGGPVGLLYIDGAHDLPSVLIDIDGWGPHVAPGGLVFIHDAFSSIGVTRAILKRHLANRRFRYVSSVRSLALFRREQMSVPQAVWNGVRIGARLSYFGRNLAVKVARRRGWQWPQAALRHVDAVDPY